MDQKPKPVSVVVNEIREIMKDRSSTDFKIYYDNHTIYGDLQYIRTKVRSAWEKKTQENYKKNDYRVDKKEKLYRTDLFAGEIEFAIDRISELLQKLQASDDFYDIEDRIREHKKILEKHKSLAKKGELYYKD